MAAAALAGAAKQGIAKLDELYLQQRWCMADR